MANRGLFGTIEDTMTSPLWLGGAALLTGDGMSGAMQGMRMGSGFQQQRKQQQAQQEWQRQFAGGGGAGASDLMEGLPPSIAPLVGAMGPEKGAQFLAQHAAKRADASTPPWWVQPGGGVHPAMRAKTELGAQRTTINNQMKGETEFDKKVGAELGNEFINANRAAATASRDLGNLEVMDRALADPNLYTGTGGEAVQGIKKAAQSLFGVDVQGVSSGELVQNLASNIAVDNRSKLPGPMSNEDRKFLVEMAPGLTKSPEGNRAIIQLGMLSKRYEIDRARVTREYAARNGGRLDAGYYAAIADLEGAYQQQFQQFMGNLRAMAPAAPRRPTAGTPLDAMRSRYGLD